jgi:two-component system CheB/CheR fusion protein
LSDAILVVLLATLYFAAAKLGLSMAFVAEQVTVVWPPTGIALATLLVIGRRVWPAVTVGAFLANVTTGAPAAAALGIAVGNTLEAVLSVWVLRRFFDFDARLARLKDAVGFVLVAAVAGTTVSATVGVTSLCLAGVKDWSDYLLLWRVWWLGDAASALVVAPPLLAAGSRLGVAWPRRRLAEGVAVCAVLFLASAFVFADVLAAHVSSRPLEYVLFPFVIWAALRLGPPGTAAVVLVASAVAVWGTRVGLGPFSGGTVQQSLFLLQAYMAVIATTGLVLSAVIAEWKAAEQRRAVEHAVAGVLARCSTLREAGRELLRVVGEGAGWDVGAIWFVGPGDVALSCQEFWHRPGTPAEEFERATRGRRFDPGVGLPGRVWASGGPAWIEDARSDPNFPRAPAAAASGLRAGFAFPILLAGRVLGVIEFFSRETRPPDARLLTMMRAVGSQLGQFVERKRAEEALHATREQLQIVTDTMSAAVTRCGRDLRYIWVSSRYAEWLGRRPEEVAGHPIADVIGEKGLAALRPHIERVLSGETVEYEAFVEFKGPGGRWIQAVYTPTFDGAGVADGWVAVVHDITEQKRAGDSLREADRRKDEFLALLGHELRNPLAPIRNALQILELRGDDPAVAARARAMIDRQATQLTRLVEELLDASRIARGKVRLAVETLNLAELVPTVAGDCRAEVEAAGLALEVSVPPEPVWVRGDRARLAQVAANLLNNAAKFTPEGGHVTVRVGAAGGEAVLCVSDTGIGIEPSILPTLFQAFRQVDADPARTKGGLGLGLAVVRGLVELHGGRAEVRSDGKGRGATFVVRLPLESDAPRPVRSAGPPAVAPACSGRVVIVEDGADAAESLRVLLELKGFEVSVARTGPDGLELCKRLRPGAVICDIGLPGMTGFEVARALRVDPATASAVLIAVSGYAQDEDRRKAREAGFAALLAKPADPDELARLLARAAG